MPPSGFSGDSITGLLGCVRSFYNYVRETVDFREEFNVDLIVEGFVARVTSLEAPASYVDGLRQSYAGMLEDLLTEVESGKHSSIEMAIEYEIVQLGKALSKLHINEKGELTER